MRVVPEKRVAKVQWFESHITPFTTNATSIGLTTAQCTDLQTKTQAARDLYTDQQAKLQAAKVATEAFYNSVDVLSAFGAGLLDAIRSKAKTTGNLNVYTLAEIPAPPTPTPVGAPGTPTGFAAVLKPNGTLELGWKCSNPAGCNNVIYQVYRKVDSTGAYEYLGGTGARTFTDLSVPQGVPSVMYQIQGTRSTAVGDAAEFIVNFGVNSGGAVTTTVANATKPAKIAA